MKRNSIIVISIFVIVVAIGSFLVLTQYKSYQVIKDQIIPIGGSARMEIPFKIDNVEEPWKLQIEIKTDYGDVLVDLLTAKDEKLWFIMLYSGSYEYKFIHTGDLKIVIRIPSYTDAQTIKFKIVAWKSYIG